MLDISDLKLTGWTPDTCECGQFKILWSSRDDEEMRRHVCIEADPCEQHQRPTPDESYLAAVETNREVNEQRQRQAEADVR